MEPWEAFEGEDDDNPRRGKSRKMKARRHVSWWFLAIFLVATIIWTGFIYGLVTDMQTPEQKLSGQLAEIDACEDGLNHYGVDRSPIQPTTQENREFLAWQCAQTFPITPAVPAWQRSVIIGLSVMLVLMPGIFGMEFATKTIREEVPSAN